MASQDTVVINRSGFIDSTSTSNLVRCDLSASEYLPFLGPVINRICEIWGMVLVAWAESATDKNLASMLLILFKNKSPCIPCRGSIVGGGGGAAYL